MPRERSTYARVVLAVLVAFAVFAPLQHLAFAGAEPHLLARAGGVAVDHLAPVPVPAPPIMPVDAAARVLASPTDPQVLVTEPDVVPAVARPAPAELAASATSLAQRFPAQHAAKQDPADPATTRWALLIGINQHRGSVADNIGSRQDAEALRTYLLAQGWRDDHILLLTDRDATGRAIRDGLRWLADKTDGSSVAVFHYSGHSKKWYGVDRDGDGEVTDEGLWPTDDDFIVDSELVTMLDPVRPSALWVSFATCNAAGFADPGLARPGRVLTFSSGEAQKSYENPSWGHSVWGWFLIEQALRSGMADLDGNRAVSVQEAWTWARPRAIDTTARQRYGAQDAVIVDDLGGELQLGVPGVQPAPRPGPPTAGPAEEPAPPRQQPAPRRSEPQPAPAREPDRRGGYLCVLCGSR